MNQNPSRIRKGRMPKTLEDALRLLPRPMPSRSLLEGIMMRIQAERRRLRLRYVLAGALAGVLGITIFTILSRQTLWEELSHSGFFSYLSILFTDPDIVANAWQEVALSLLESLPVVTLIIILVSFLFLFGGIYASWRLHLEKRALRHLAA